MNVRVSPYFLSAVAFATAHHTPLVNGNITWLRFITLTLPRSLLEAAATAAKLLFFVFVGGVWLSMSCCCPCVNDEDEKWKGRFDALMKRWGAAVNHKVRVV